MTHTSTHRWQHSHVFDQGNPVAERRTRWAVWLTALMMVGEIVGGWWYNSMALLADGWHMSSHALALGLSLVAYAAARRYSEDRRFAFGTWKIEILGGYSSAIMLLGVAGLMLFQSVERLFSPAEIHYNQAISIAIVGLLVNLVCAWLLREDHGHHHAHHAGEGTAHHHDLNLRSAYLHVITDAATSVLAIVALLGGKLWGAAWLDPLMGIVGAVGARATARDGARAAGRGNGYSGGRRNPRSFAPIPHSANHRSSCMESRQRKVCVYRVARYVRLDHGRPDSAATEHS